MFYTESHGPHKTADWRYSRWRLILDGPVAGTSDHSSSITGSSNVVRLRIPHAAGGWWTARATPLVSGTRGCSATIEYLGLAWVRYADRSSVDPER